MKVKLIRPGTKQIEEICTEDGITVEEIGRKYLKDEKYPFVAARKNNRMVHLATEAEEGDVLEFLDMRNQSAVHIYQRSVTFLFLKAAYDVLGSEENFRICFPVNNGIQIRPVKGVRYTADQIKRIKLRIEELIRLDVPLRKVPFTEAQAMEFYERAGMEEKKNMIARTWGNEGSTMYSIEGFCNFFYDILLPSAGYIYSFDIIEYYDGILIRYPRTDSPGGLPEYRDDKILLQIYNDTDNWENLVGIEYVDDLNSKIRNGELKDLILLSEALHEKKIADIAENIAGMKKRVILIAGPSSSGKTSFAGRLRVQLMAKGLEPVSFSTDDYFVNRDDMVPGPDGRLDFEALEAVDTELFNNHMNRLLGGETVDVPVYNFITGKKEFGKRMLSIGDDQPVIVEGIHGLNDKLTAGVAEEYKYRIYISPLVAINVDMHNVVSTSDCRLLRRMTRDSRTRGKSAAVTIRSWPDVRKGEEKNIFPYISRADVLFNSYLIYELPFIKKYVRKLLYEVTDDMDEFCEAERLLNFLRFFDEGVDEWVIPNNSIIREFTGGSVFFDEQI